MEEPTDLDSLPASAASEAMFAAPGCSDRLVQTCRRVKLSNLRLKITGEDGQNPSKRVPVCNSDTPSRLLLLFLIL